MKEKKAVQEARTLRGRAKKNPVVIVLSRFKRGTIRRLNAMVNRIYGRFRLPPPKLELDDKDGYIIEVEDRWDVVYAYPKNTRKWMGRKVMGGMNIVAKGGGKLLESLGEKRLPGLERALYGDTIGETTSLFGSAVVQGEERRGAKRRTAANIYGLWDANVMNNSSFATRFARRRRCTGHRRHL